jgi:hypothetical protein
LRYELEFVKQGAWPELIARVACTRKTKHCRKFSATRRKKCARRNAQEAMSAMMNSVMNLPELFG